MRVRALAFVALVYYSYNICAALRSDTKEGFSVLAGVCTVAPAMTITLPFFFAFVLVGVIVVVLIETAPP